MKLSFNRTTIDEWRKWIGVIWFVIEVNLTTGNIFGFPALFKVLPQYGVYSSYCQSSNSTNSTEHGCNQQTHQYQSALTLGIIFFNLPSVFVGILIDIYGARFTKLIGIIFHVIGWLALALVKSDKNKLSLSQLSYIWMSYGIVMFFSAFLFLDWKFPILNLGYTFDSKLKQTITTPVDEVHSKTKWYEQIYRRIGLWEHLTNPLYIVVVLYLGFLLMPNILLSVTWYPWVYYINHNDIKISDNYTFVFNMAALSQIALCPMVGFLLSFRANRSLKQKLLNAAIAQTCSWILNIIFCIICMFVNSSFIIPALIFNYIARSAIVAGSQAVITTLHGSSFWD
ncbi:unnamed protein product [Rotaria sordida]|uniref:Uncharacterized protein n=1 Tax=Rotaria sordida TaxID=392033 RepID=A0A814QES2_9BILA|nr:unnamed protein product [Rotaria sordida]CAF1338233.1 unnamed protein product [Rotaria sordida]